MARTTGDVIVETLADWGVEVVFGLPGDGVNGVIEAFRKAQDRIRFVQVRHEEAAALAACGYAKFTGRLGVCVSTSGPGGIHLLNGLYDAKLDHQPVLAITGLQFHDLIGTSTQQDVELDKLFQDVAVFNQRVMGGAHARNVTTLACRTALAARGVAHITIPVDVQSHEVADDQRSERNVAGHNTDVRSRSARLPDEGDVVRAASLLNEGKKTVILAGAGALGAGEALERVAERLGAPIAKALLGKAAVPDDSPYTTGGVGLLGTRPSQDALESCDTLLIVGSGFPYIEYYPKPGQARAVQIDLDPARIGLRYPVEVGLAGDAARSLEALLPHLADREDRSFLEEAQKAKREWDALMDERGTAAATPMKPQVVAHELGRRLAPDAIVTCDSGTNTVWWARHIKAQRGQMHSVSGTLATMGCALPYAIAAQVAHPGRQVVAFVGDGGFSMTMADFATCVKYGLPVKVVVVNNSSLGMIKWEQLAFLGNPEYVCDLSPIDFGLFAKACGATGFTVEDPAEIGAVLDEALAAPGPAIVNAVVDTHEPPMPPKIKASQLKHLAEAMLKGTPARGKIALTIGSNTVRELL